MINLPIFIVSSLAYSTEPTDLSHIHVISAEGDAPEATPVSLGDLFFFYSLDPDAPVVEYQEQGPSLWRYDGQQVFETHPMLLAGTVLTTESEGGGAEVEPVRVDRWGRRWVVLQRLRSSEEVIAAAAEEERSAWATAHVPLDTAGDSGLLPSGADAVAPEVGLHFADLQAWDTVDCDGVLGADHSIWEEESRVASDFTFRTHRASLLLYVFLESPSVGGSTFATKRCSSVMVNPQTLLTNAHCVLTSFGGDVPPGHFRACRRGNLASQGANAVCFTPNSVTVNPQYDPGLIDFKDDFAVLTFSTPIVSANDIIPMSVLGPEEWGENLTRTFQYPGFDPGLPAGCGANSASAQNTSFFVRTEIVGGTSQNLGVTGAIQFRESISGFEYSATLIKTKFDSAGGASGSPYVYCVSEDCAATPRLIGLQAAWGPTTKRHYGPRVDEFRDFVLDNSAP